MCNASSLTLPYTLLSDLTNISYKFIFYTLLLDNEHSTCLKKKSSLKPRGILNFFLLQDKTRQTGITKKCNLLSISFEIHMQNYKYVQLNKT